MKGFRLLQVLTAILLVVVLVYPVMFKTIPLSHGASQTLNQAIPQEPLQQTSKQHELRLSTPPPISGISVDRGSRSVVYSFQPNGAASYRVAGDNLTLSPPGLALTSLLNTTLPSSLLWYNSTVVEYQIVNTIVLGHAISLTVIYRAIPGHLNLHVSYTGTVSGVVGLFLKLENPLGRPERNKQYSVFFGDIGYDWSDTAAFKPVYYNSTHTINWNVSSSFTLDPIALADHGAIIGCGGGPPATCTFPGWGTSEPNVLIIAEFYSSTLPSGCSNQGTLDRSLPLASCISSITDTSGQALQWKLRSAIGKLSVWYALVPTTKTSFNVTATLAGSGGTTQMFLVNFKGVNPGNIWDPGLGTGTTTGGFIPGANQAIGSCAPVTLTTTGPGAILGFIDSAYDMSAGGTTYAVSGFAWIYDKGFPPSLNFNMEWTISPAKQSILVDFRPLAPNPCFIVGLHDVIADALCGQNCPQQGPGKISGSPVLFPLPNFTAISLQLTTPIGLVLTPPIIGSTIVIGGIMIGGYAAKTPYERLKGRLIE